MGQTAPHAPSISTATALRYCRRTGVALAVAQTLAWVAMGSAIVATPAAHAQPAEAARAYSIPAGPLTTVLNRFGREAGILLSFSTEMTEGLRSGGLAGTHTVPAALDALLAGTPLQAVRQADGGYLLRRVPSVAPAAAPGSGEASLPTVTVKAQAERGELTEGTGSYTTRSTSAATGMNLSLRETPQSVTVMTRERMDEQGLNSLADALSEVTGVYVETIGTPIGNNTGIYARGYFITSFRVDGVDSLDTGSYELNTFDTAVYDSLTVVRGATGLLTGSGNPGATIHLTRKRPTSEFQASLSQGLGRWNQHRTVGDVGGPLNQAGTLRGRFVAAYDGGKSWVDRYRGRKSVAYGVLEADLSNRTLLTLALEHSRTSGRGAGGDSGYDMTFGDGSLVPASRSDSALADWSHFSSERTLLNVKIEHRFNDNWRGQLNYGHGRSGLDGEKVMTWVGDNASADMGLFNRSWNTKPTRKNDLAGKIEGRYELFGRKNDLVAGFRAFSI
ncbi:TonB-dependent siderophore receptor [Ottowia sp.]|uniref:TonB-dependent siderophore receptor n=1 Tax=Ottowia sp. TaxID=1898956 RepID=UPI0039E4324F